jgi:diguanylate cyclase (GGDEF)-like protein
MSHWCERRVGLPASAWREVVATLGEGVVLLDGRARVLSCNRAAEAMLGTARDGLLGRRLGDVPRTVIREDGGRCGPDQLPSAVVLNTGAAVEGCTLGVELDAGGVRWLEVCARPLGEAAEPAAVVVVFSDITARHVREQQLRRRADADELTGLPNRRAFVETLGRHLASRRREDSRGTLLLVDLDRFKELNDSLGHAVGDRLLVRAAEALGERLRSGDVLGRLAGDEFAVLLPRTEGEQAARVAAELADRLRREVAPVAHGGTRPLTASIGIVELNGAAGASPERALQQADDAMYAAKRAGRDRTAVVHSDANADGRQTPAGAELAKRTRQLALANALGTRLADMSDPQAIAEATVDELHRAFGYHLCAVIRIRPDDYVEALAVRGSSFNALRLRDWCQPRGRGLIGRCLRQQTPVLINDVETADDYQWTPETRDVRAELVVPLFVGGDLWGAINLEELVIGAFDHDDVQLLTTVATQVGAALRAALLTQRLAALRDPASAPRR